MKQGRLHLAHGKFSSINANFLLPTDDGISKNKEMGEVKSGLGGGWNGGTPTKTELRELWDAKEEECWPRHRTIVGWVVRCRTYLEIGFRCIGSVKSQRCHRDLLFIIDVDLTEFFLLRVF